MPNDIQVRAVGPGDERILAYLCADIQALHVRAQPDVFKEVDLDGLEQWFRVVLAEASAEGWLGYVGEQAVGYALVRKERRPANVFCHERRWHEIDQIGVRADFQGRGIARHLLQRVADSAAAQGVFELELNTWYFNERAQTAFSKLGFSVKTVRFHRKVEYFGPY